MTTIPLSLDGYTDLPPGKIANVVTFLERIEPPETPSAAPPGLSVRHVERPTVAWFRGIYRRIGDNWLWFSRAIMPETKLKAVIEAPTTSILALEKDGETIGLAELDFDDTGDVEIVSFGVVAEASGTGAARFLMERTLAHAFRDDVNRVWLHTCTFDHPAAVRFYLARGFHAYKFAIEVSDDPRTLGLLPETAAPHVPMLMPVKHKAD